MSSSGSVISRGCTLRGDIHTSGDILIDGRLEGNIEASGRVSVAAGAVVTQAIVARSVRIDGTVEGTVHALEQVEVGHRGRLLGEVQGSLSVGPGGFVRDHQKQSRPPVTPIRMYESAPPRASSTASTRSITDADIGEALFLPPDERRTRPGTATEPNRRQRPRLPRRGGTNPGIRPPGTTITPRRITALDTDTVQAALARREAFVAPSDEPTSPARWTAPDALSDDWFQEEDQNR